MNKQINKIQRIGLIGPVLPFRGGIAQHTTMLHRTLSSKTELLTLSFSRQYPQWLYHGRSDRDQSFHGHKEHGVSYIIDSLNPLTWLKACRRMAHFDPDAVIIPWWSAYWAFCFLYTANYMQRRKIRVIFLCHNIIDHEFSGWKLYMAKKVFSKADALLTHTICDRERLLALTGAKDVAVHPHPIYNQFPLPVSVMPRRAKLELLFFGFVRQYKGVDILIEAMNLVKDIDVFLTIAGEWWWKDKYLLEKITANGLAEKIEIIDRYIPEHETAMLFSRADAVVLPYRRASGSGVVSLAYHYGKPVIASKTGGLSEAIEDGISGRLIEPENPAALANAIKEFSSSSLTDFTEGVKKAEKKMTWNSFCSTVLNLASRKMSG